MALEDAFRIAGQKIGLNEREQNAALQDFMRTGGQNLDPATTAWCAAFVNASLSHAGMQGTGRLNARSFMEWGQATNQPRRGDLAVFSRGDPNGWQGHVGFFDGFGEDGRIRVLGGNQGNAVSMAYYDPSRLLGFRTAGENTGGEQQRPDAQGLAGLFDGGVSDMNILPQQTAPRQDEEQERTRRRRQALFGAGGLADVWGGPGGGA